MFCRYCGKVIPNDSIFCPCCGAKLEEAASNIKIEDKETDDNALLETENNIETEGDENAR